MGNGKWQNAASNSRMFHLWLFLGLQDYISISKVALCELHGLRSPCTHLCILIIYAATVLPYDGKWELFLNLYLCSPNRLCWKKKICSIPEHSEEVCFCSLSNTLKFPQCSSFIFWLFTIWSQSESLFHVTHVLYQLTEYSESLLLQTKLMIFFTRVH